MSAHGYLRSGDIHVHYRQECPNDGKTGCHEHYHEAYELALLIEGEAQLFVRDTDTTWNAGELVLIQNHCPHWMVRDPGRAYVRYRIHFTQKIIQSLCNSLGQNRLLDDLSTQSYVKTRLKPQILDTAEKQFAEIHTLFRHLQNNNVDERFLGVVKAHLYILLSRLEDTTPPGKSSNSRRNSKDDWVSKITDYIDANYAEEFSLPQVAGTIGLSPCYISRIFSDVMGMSLVDYLQRKRIAEAKTLLRTTKDPTAIISHACGFSSIRYFHRVFRRIAGQTPLQYRRAAGNR